MSGAPGSFDLASAAARSAADAQARAADAARPIKRKRRDPTTDAAAAPAGSASGQNNATATDGHSASARVNGGVPPFDSFLQTLSSSMQTTLQNEILSIFFPQTKATHGAHLYRQLPGPQPFSIARKDLHTLATNDYWACEKSDGERAMLYVSKDRQATYLLDRKFLVKQLHHPVYASLWGVTGDSLMDGELVMHDAPLTATGGPQATFMIFDLLLLNGTRMMDKRLSERLAGIGSGIVLPYRSRFPQYSSGAPAPPPANAADGSDHPLAIRAKSFHRKHHLKDGIFDHIKPLHGGAEYEYNDGKRCNKNDGVIFTPENDDYMCKNVQLLKWKWPGLNTLDFLCRAPWFDHDGKLMLYSNASQLSDGPKGPTVSIHVRSAVLTPEKRAWFLREVQGKTTAIAEMQYDARTSAWTPKLFRWDKSSPNFMTTVMGTLETIIDNITPNDLYEVCNKKGQAVNNAHAPHTTHAPPPQRHTSAPAIPPQQHQFWSSGASAAAPAAPPAHTHAPAPAPVQRPASPAPLPPSFADFASAPAPLITSKTITAYEQIAAAPEETIVQPTRLFGD